MPWGLARLLAGFLLLLGLLPAAAAQVAPAPVQPIVLRSGAGPMATDGRARYWIDPRGEATIEQATRSAGTLAFQPAPADQAYKLGATAALWVHLRLQRPPEERHDWVLEFPIPVLDRVTVYQREAGQWRAESAGDTLPVAGWAEPGRYPHFRIALAPGEVRDVYVRIRHTTAANFPIALETAPAHSRHLQIEYLVLGAAFGGLLVLIIGCLAKAWATRDALFGWYAGYAALTGLAVSSYTGAAAHLLWPRFGALADAPMPMLACAAVAAAMLFVRNILGLARRMHQQHRMLLVLAAVGFALALVPALLPKSVHLPLVGAYVVVAVVTAILLSAAAWMRGDAVAKWVFFAYVPMALSVLASVSRVFGWAPVSVGTQYAVVAAMCVEVPLLLVALFIRSRDRHSAEVREQALTTHDALTGLLAPHLFTDRLRQVVTRHRREGESAAVMYIELVNYGRIREHFGTAVAEQSLLRSVIKLRRLLRDVDTASRVGEARFAVILEGASGRSSVTERATRLIASGLMPLPGLKPDVALQFHIAALLLNERPMEADELQAALEALLARMSPRTRRPIRFVEVETPPASEPGDSSMFTPEGEPARESQFVPAP